MVLARARPCGWTGCPEERARVLGSTRHQMLPWSSLQARQTGFCLYLSTLRFSKGRECADEGEAGVQVSEELFCRELRSSQSRLYQPLEEGWSWYSRGPSGFRGPAPLGSQLLTRPLGQVRSSLHHRRGTCPSSSSRVLQDDFEPFAKIRFFDLPLAFRDPHSVRLPCPEQLQREDGSRCSAALVTVLDLYGLSWFCSFTVASRLRNHSSSKQQRRQQQAHVRATGCV